MKKEIPDNESKPTRILVKGLNWSGSGAVVGFLNEFKGVYQIPGGIERTAPAGYQKLGEFDLYRKCGLVGDYISSENYNFLPYLKVYLERKNEYKAISNFIRFLVHNKIKTPFYFKIYLKQARLRKQLSTINQSFSNLILNFENSDTKTEKINHAKSWVDSMVDIIGDHNKKAVVFDHPIHFNKNTDNWPTVFDPYKLLIVYRDPRDQIAEMIRNKKIMKHMDGPLGHMRKWGGIDTAVQIRIDLIAALMEAVDETISLLDPAKYLLLSFEDLVLNYQDSRNKIIRFLDFKEEDHIHQFDHFDPNWSKQNIGIYRGINYEINNKSIAKLMDWYYSKKNS